MTKYSARTSSPSSGVVRRTATWQTSCLKFTRISMRWYTWLKCSTWWILFDHDYTCCVYVLSLFSCSVCLVFFLSGSSLTNSLCNQKWSWKIPDLNGHWKGKLIELSVPYGFRSPGAFPCGNGTKQITFNKAMWLFADLKMLLWWLIYSW